MPKVFVSGCFDMLHSGHVAFFEEAAQYGDLYVGIGADTTLFELKGRKPINTEQERLYMVKALKMVKDAWINSGNGLLDFESDVRKFKPDIFFVNEDGHNLDKEILCAELGIEYIVSKRIPHENLPIRSTTALRKECNIPYRIDLAGGWLDQPFISKEHGGPVLTISIEPDIEFLERAGMSTRTRKRAIELWQTDIPEGDKTKLAKILFSYDNPPGTKDVSGSQDAYGIVLPGLNKLDYSGNYLPEKITSIHQQEILQWIEQHLVLIALYPRPASYNPLEGTCITLESIKALQSASDNCWNAILAQDVVNFGKAMKDSFEAQCKMFPTMVSDKIQTVITQYQKDALGWKLSGAGGGGYLIFVVENQEKIKGIKIRIRKS